MALFKCKMCGGTIEFQQGDTIGRCDSCGTRQTLPNLDDDKKTRLYERANKLRMSCEFDRAAGVYEDLINNFPDDAESFWGLILCRYGIEYVDDPATGRKVPTCHRSSYDSLMDDPDFEMVMETSEGEARSLYREEAKQIEEIRKGINLLSESEEPYDIFICYKETEDDGERTLDSVLAQEIYDILTADGYRVFFSRISLEDKIGTEYEPYIFAALNSAKVMLAIGTSYDHYNAVWVKNEWSRYLKLMANDRSKFLIPCFKDIDAYDIPKEFRRFQAQDLGKVGALQDLMRGIEKLIGKQKQKAVAGVIDREQLEEILMGRGLKDTAGMLKRGFMALSDRDYDTASDLFEDILSSDLENAEAYMGKILVGCECENMQVLSNRIMETLFSPEWIAVNPGFSVQDVLKAHFRYYDRMDPVTLSTVSQTHIKLLTRLSALKAVDEQEDYLRLYLEKMDNSYSLLRTYDRFLQYADESLLRKYDVKAELAPVIRENLEKEERLYQEARNKCDEGYFTQLIRDIDETVVHNSLNLIRERSEKLNQNQRKLTQLKAGTGGSRTEIRQQITAIKNENAMLEQLNNAAKKARAKNELDPTFNAGAILRRILEKQGYDENFPIGKPFVMGTWKDKKGNVPIRWKAIGRNQDKVLMVTEQVIDVCPYAFRPEELIWSRSALRKFLMDFYRKAFSETEKSIILPYYVHSGAALVPGQVMDRVTCLSVEEWTKYVPSLAVRKTQFSENAMKRFNGYKELCFWTRDNGRLLTKRDCGFTVLDCNGQIMNITNMLGRGLGVRPAMWITIP